MLDELRTIEIGKNEVVIRLIIRATMSRAPRMDANHPADVKLSLHGHSIGRWEGDTLVIDTIAFEPNPSGLGINAPSSAGKHTVERLTLIADPARLRYESTWNSRLPHGAGHIDAAVGPRPDLEFRKTGRFDKDVAGRYKDSVPK